MVEFFLPLALIGATLIVTEGGIFAWLRRLGPKALRCNQCVGFWVGAAGGGSELVALGHGRVVDAFVVGCTTSFLSLLAGAILTKLLGEPKEVSSDGPPDQ